MLYKIQSAFRTFSITFFIIFSFLICCVFYLWIFICCINLILLWFASLQNRDKKLLIICLDCLQKREQDEIIADSLDKATQLVHLAQAMLYIVTDHQPPTATKTA